MISEALQLLRAELLAYFATTPDQADVTLGTFPGSGDAQVLLSLVNVEEEAALRNSSPYQRNATGGFDLVNPPVFLNLYVLVGASPGRSGDYEAALQRLARVVQCFQQKRQLSPAAVPRYNGPPVALQVSVDMHPLSFERASQLWSTLGGQQVPCVLYKLRVVEEQGTRPVGSGPAITAVPHTAAAPGSSTLPETF